MDYRYEDVAKMIDHSLLNPSLTTSDLDEGCRLALDYDVASVCIMPCVSMLRAAAIASSTDSPAMKRRAKPSDFMP